MLMQKSIAKRKRATNERMKVRPDMLFEVKTTMRIYTDMGGCGDENNPSGTVHIFSDGR